MTQVNSFFVTNKSGFDHQLMASDDVTSYSKLTNSAAVGYFYYHYRQLFIPENSTFPTARQWVLPLDPDSLNELCKFGLYFLNEQTEAL